MHSVADRLALAEHIQTLWYPQWTGAWLKAVAVAPLIAGKQVATPRDVLQVFLDDDLYNWTPEDSAYGTFTDCEWRPIDRAELLRCVDTMLRDASDRLAEVRAEQAAEQTQATAGGCLDSLPRPSLDDDMTDLGALRRWFTAELWGQAEPTWFTNMVPGFAGEPGVVGLDGDVLALLWLP